MNNDRKQMISEDPASDLSKAAKKMQQNFLVENDTEILLPDHVTMTQEILDNNICRVCATYHESGPKLVPLYPNDEGTQSLAQLINAFLPIQVAEDDGLPKVACSSCSKKLHAWRVMWDGCTETQKLLASKAELLNGEAGAPSFRMERNAEKSSEGSPDRDSDASSDSLPSPAPLAALRRALRRLRDHYAAHHLPASPPPAPPGDAARPGDERDLDRYDDLTRDNMRRDRFDPETRRALDAARMRSEGRTLYECATCGRRLASPHAFVHHARIHTGERPHVCHVCGARFRAPQGLARHVAETHERRRRRACRLCRATFANEQNLRQHLRTHTGERPFRCAACGRRFAQSGALHAHARTHSPRRPHACALCGAAFRLRAGLARHARRHAGVRPHRCACGRAFHARHELLAHLPAHLPAAPHACALCPAAYRLRRALRDHARRKHPDAPPPPPLTRASFAGTAPT